MTSGAHPHFEMLSCYGLSRDKLREAVQGDPVARAEAQAELAAVQRINPERCAISKEYAEILREALA